MADASTFPFDPSRALPNEAFRSAALAALELEHIWHRDWVFVGTADSIPDPGDQLAVTVGTHPVLLLRQQDGTLAALSNLCAHRGTLLVDGTANGKRIQCPYHAWTYAEDGRLLSVPFADKAEHCLPRYRVAVWHGLVFVSLNDDVEPFDDRVAQIEPLLAERNMDELHHWPRHHESEQWQCNWKLAVLNAMESYHLFQVHPETLEPYTPTKESYYVRGSARATATGGSSKGEDDYLLISLPPGFVGVLTPGSFIWQAVTPIAVDRCQITTGGAFSAQPPERQSFLPEDKAICERGQRGAAGDFAPGRLLEVERVVADFGHYVNWRINDVEPPALVERR